MVKKIFLRLKTQPSRELCKEEKADNQLLHPQILILIMWEIVGNSLISLIKGEVMEIHLRLVNSILR